MHNLRQVTKHDASVSGALTRLDIASYIIMIALLFFHNGWWRTHQPPCFSAETSVEASRLPPVYPTRAAAAPPDRSAFFFCDGA